MMTMGRNLLELCLLLCGLQVVSVVVRIVVGVVVLRGGVGVASGAGPHLAARLLRLLAPVVEDGGAAVTTELRARHCNAGSSHIPLLLWTIMVHCTG